MTENNWYSNKELFEMIDKFKEEVNDLTVEMKETKMLIRDYNGLRKNINDNNRKVGELERKIETLVDSRKEYIGYIIAAISTLFLILNYFK